LVRFHQASNKEYNDWFSDVRAIDTIGGESSSSLSPQSDFDFRIAAWNIMESALTAEQQTRGEALVRGNY
jgi:hypothetical protein